MSNLGDWVNELIRSNTIISVITLSFLLNIFYDIVKKLTFTFTKNSIEQLKKAPPYLNKWALNNINDYISIKKNETLELKAILTNEKNVTNKIIERTFKNFIFIILIIIGLTFVKSLDNNLLYYSFLGLASSRLIVMVSILAYDYKTIKNSNNYEESIEKLKNDIEKLEKLKTEL